MKKILLICVGCILILASIQVLLEFGGGIRGIVRTGESWWYSRQAITERDPGQCAFIGDYFGGNRDYFRSKCLAEYGVTIERRNDCGSLSLTSSQKGIENMSRAEYYREDCLINHYKYMLGNGLVAQWLPETCTKLSEKLIILSHFSKEINELVGTDDLSHHAYEPMSESDIALVGDCEKLLDTPRIYATLRGKTTPSEDAYYVELQKKKQEKLDS